MLTAKTKESLSIFGKRGLLASVSTITGMVVTIVGGMMFMNAQGQNLLITPVVKKIVDERVDSTKKECQQALANHIQRADEEFRDMKEDIKEQSKLSQKTFDKILEIAEDVAEMKGRMK